jgi:hypothetical protein
MSEQPPLRDVSMLTLDSWCSSAIPSWANTVNSINLLPCAGNFSETCGGGGLLAIYNNTQSTATLAAPGAGPTPAAAGTYFGCAQEGTNGRVLSGASMSSVNMTLEMCRAYCDSKGFFYSGGMSFPLPGMSITNQIQLSTHNNAIAATASPVVVACCHLTRHAQCFVAATKARLVEVATGSPCSTVLWSQWRHRRLSSQSSPRRAVPRMAHGITLHVSSIKDHLVLSVVLPTQTVPL